MILFPVTWCFSLAFTERVLWSSYSSVTFSIRCLRLPLPGARWSLYLFLSLSPCVCINFQALQYCHSYQSSRCQPRNVMIDHKRRIPGLIVRVHPKLSVICQKYTLAHPYTGTHPRTNSYQKLSCSLIWQVQKKQLNLTTPNFKKNTQFRQSRF